MWQGIFNAVIGIAALVGILDYFGVKPRQRSDGKMPLSRKWKLVIMLTLVGASLAMSAYGFYRSLHPRIVERVVEKEKLVPQECPPTSVPTHQHFKPKPSPQALKGKPVVNNDAPTEPIQQDCGGGNCAASVGQQGGITAGQLTVNGPIPPTYTFTEEVIAGTDRKKINVHVHTDRAVRGAIVGMLFSGPIDYIQANNPSVPGAGISQQTWGQLQNNRVPTPNSLYVIINEPTVFLPSQELIVPVTSQNEVHVVRIFPVET